MDSIILTVHNRDMLTLTNTFSQLSKQDLTEAEIIVVDDGSTEDYTDLKEMFSAMPIRWLRADTVKDRPETYHIKGHNNPAHVNNLALKSAEGDNIFWLSSDTMLPPHALSRARVWMEQGAIWTCNVMDTDTGNYFLGPDRIFPMCWALASSRAAVDAVGGFDEKYLEGMGYEDNDFVGALFRHVGKLVVDGSVIALHQSHADTWMSDSGVGREKSRLYTEEKWGGIPWAYETGCVPFKKSAAGRNIILNYTGRG